MTLHVLIGFTLQLYGPTFTPLTSKYRCIRLDTRLHTFLTSPICDTTPKQNTTILSTDRSRLGRIHSTYLVRIPAVSLPGSPPPQSFETGSSTWKNQVCSSNYGRPVVSELIFRLTAAARHLRQRYLTIADGVESELSVARRRRCLHALIALSYSRRHVKHGAYLRKSMSIGQQMQIRRIGQCRAECRHLFNEPPFSCCRCDVCGRLNTGGT